MAWTKPLFAPPSRFASNRLFNKGSPWISRRWRTSYFSSLSSWGEKLMRLWKMLGLVLLLGVMPLRAAAQTSEVDQVVDRIVTQEKAEMEMLRQYSPLVETYIQMMRIDPSLGPQPAGDKYFLGKADLSKGVELASLSDPRTSSGVKHKMDQLTGAFTFEFLPRGFLQMIYVDLNGFTRQNYRFDYVRREFLGDVRCLVFDVTPTASSGKGRFMGRIWVEDQSYHVVRFNGAYSGASRTDFYFHFDSWRVMAGQHQW